MNSIILKLTPTETGRSTLPPSRLNNANQRSLATFFSFYSHFAKFVFLALPLLPASLSLACSLVILVLHQTNLHYYLFTFPPTIGPVRKPIPEILTLSLGFIQ